MSTLKLNKNILISVVMSVYNGDKYLSDSIESILNQTYENFEFIIINDGSEDSSIDIINKYMNYDKRIVLINRKNRGLAYSLNEGIAKSKGEYIARMDADDWSYPNRLSDQINYMIKNDLDICGSFIDIIDDKGNFIRINEYPLFPNEIKFMSLFNPRLAHPTVIFKRNVFAKINYNEELISAQDYKLWTDAIQKNLKLGNINKSLLKYRKHSGQISVARSQEQAQTAQKIRTNYAQYLGVNEEELVLLLSIIQNQASYTTLIKTLCLVLNLSQKYQLDKFSSEKLLHYVYSISYPKNIIVYFSYLIFLKKNSFQIDFKLKELVKALLFYSLNSKLYTPIRKLLLR
ncbi:MAG: glycosyltransferase [Acholeplasma sp.]